MLNQEQLEQLFLHVKTTETPLLIENNLYVQIPASHAKVIYGPTCQSRNHLGPYDFHQKIIPMALLTEDGEFYYDDNYFELQNELSGVKSFTQAAQEIYQYVRENGIPKLKEVLPEVSLTEGTISYYTSYARRDIFYQKPRSTIERFLCSPDYHPAILGKEKTIEEVIEECCHRQTPRRIAEDISKDEFYHHLYNNTSECLEEWELELYDAVRELQEHGARTIQVIQYRNNIENDTFARSYDIHDFITEFSKRHLRQLAYLTYKGHMVYDARPYRPRAESEHVSVPTNIITR